MINEVSVNYRSRMFCYVKYCIRITVIYFISTLFWRDNNSLWQIDSFFSFPAIDEQTTAVTQSTFGVLHVDFHFVFKLNIVISQFSQKKEYRCLS